MNRATAFLILSVFMSFRASGQSVGLGPNADSSSTFVIGGSFGVAYRAINSSSYSISESDCHISWNGPAAGTFTLPAALAMGSGNYQGRLYFIKNTSLSYPLTVNANGSELITDQSGANVSSVSLQPGNYYILISKGATTGAAWEMAVAGTANYVRPYFNASRPAYTPGAGGVNVSGYSETADDKNNFNPATGVFTAPEDGYYLFNYSTSTSAGAGGVLAHRLSTGASAQRLNVQANTSFGQSLSNCYFLKLTKGSTISYFVAFANSTGSGSVTSTFSGIKLK